MPTKSPQSPNVHILEETEEVTLADLTRTCRVHAEWVMELIEEGVIEPLGRADPNGASPQRAWCASGKAQRLQRDLGVNLPGIALALQLLDRIDALEARLRAAGEPPLPDDAE